MSGQIVTSLIQTFSHAEFWMGILSGATLAILFGRQGKTSRD